MSEVLQAIYHRLVNALDIETKRYLYPSFKLAIFEDIAGYYKLKTANLHFFKQILNYLSSIPPGEINAHNLAKIPACCTE